MADNDYSNHSNCSESSSDYLNRAVQACEAGNLVLGMHLYLAAYEKAAADPNTPEAIALASLREAWDLACSLKERSMAEYVFEKIEPYLTGEEIARFANKLQDLALDRLEEYGFSREELQDMAEMISQDFLDAEGSLFKVESISIPHVMMPGVTMSAAPAQPYEEPLEASFETPTEETEEVAETATEEPLEAATEEAGEADVVESFEGPGVLKAATEERPPSKRGHVGVGTTTLDFNPYDYFDTSSVGKSYHAATTEGSGAYAFTLDADRAAAAEKARAANRAEHETNTATEAAPAAEANQQTVSSAADAMKTASDSVNESALGKAQSQPPAPTSQQATPQQPAVSKSGTNEQPAKPASVQGGIVPKQGAPARKQAEELPSMPDVAAVESKPLNYRTLAGYSSAITIMRELGIGLQGDSGFQNFVKMMNARHGLDRMPALDTLLFSSPVIEDATRFVDATIGEIGLPVLRMSMEEGIQGMPMLCVTTQGNNRPRMNHAQNRFESPCILVLDDLDMWALPQPPENVEGLAGFVMANMSRGAREALNLIRSAVEDPDIFVLATTTAQAEVDPFFYELLEPITIIDITYPTESERADIWNEIKRNHPSMRTLDRADLLRYSAGLPRYDIYMAARAAIEEAYKAGLSQRMFLPITPQNMFDKLAACQPLDSDEYRAIEEAIITNFRESLDDLESLIDDATE